MNRNDIAILTLETTGRLMTIIGDVVPNDAASAGIRLGAALIGGIVEALSYEDPEFLLEKLRNNPLPDIRETEKEQDEEIERYIKERFGQ